MTHADRKGREGSAAARRAPIVPTAFAAIALTALTVFGAALPVAAQSRPLPGPLPVPRLIRQAIDNETRSPDGHPGKHYWTNYTRYRIEAELDPETAELRGRETVVYENRSRGELPALFFNLYQNLHAPGAVRNEPVEVTGGVHLERVAVQGVELPDGIVGRRAGYQVQGTVMALRLPEPLEKGDTVAVEIEWSVTLPQNGAGRMGHSEHEVYFVGYWFPKAAVFDDIRGWDAENYMGNAEFYDGFGDYEVALTVPEGWTVMGTGELLNPAMVYTPTVLERLRAAAEADTVVAVVTRRDRREGAVTVPGVDGKLVYRFRATNVRDFAWTASNVQRWDATSAVVPDRDGDGREDRVLIHSFWRDDRAPLWSKQAAFAKHAIEHHSRYTGIPYPWPHMTSVEGADIIGGGMEFPMLTLIGPYNGRTSEDLYNVTAHELAHMWVPMIVATNERRYAWMDEGSTTFLEDQARPDLRPGENADSIEAANYVRIARLELEAPMMTHGDYYPPGPAYGTASYSKPATLLVTLRALLGEDVFMRAYREFLRDWAYKHPTPWDFFNTFERVSGRDLDWFWVSWYFHTWALDQAVAEVRSAADGGHVVVIEDRGWAPMPAHVRIWTKGGVRDEEIPVDRWLEGRTRVEIVVPAEAGEVEKVEIDPEGRFPDLDRGNNRWRAGD
ncbi:MAG: M1 family peptidase [Gemmatimonadetes bacterium]|nr:MAG: M1 family peptidase [Gemmatimonadota bacterium]